MKKLFLSAVSAFAVAGAAVAADSTQFGVLQVNSAAKRTLVAIPWVEASTSGSADIAVSNLILTANLTVNDTLDVLDGSGQSLNRWILAEGAGSVLYWNSVTMVGEGGSKSASPAANSATIPRGSAVVLIRQNPTNDVGVTIPFYVMGQVAEKAALTTIQAGSASAPCYNMIAPPSTVAQHLNGSEHSATWAGTIDPADRIYLAQANGWTQELKYDNAVWKIKTKVYDKEEGSISTTWVEYTGTIPVGTGFWYVSKGGTPTVTWDDVPVVEK